MQLTKSNRFGVNVLKAKVMDLFYNFHSDITHSRLFSITKLVNLQKIYLLLDEMPVRVGMLEALGIPDDLD